MIPIKIPVTFSTELKQIILKLTGNYKRSRIDRVVLRKRNKAGGITLPDFRQCCEVMAVKIDWFWPKMDTWVDEAELRAHPRTVIHSATEEAGVHNEEKTASLASGVWKAG